MKSSELPLDVAADLKRVHIELQATLDHQVEGDPDFATEERLLKLLDNPESSIIMTDLCDMFLFYQYTVDRTHEVPALDAYTRAKE